MLNVRDATTKQILENQVQSICHHWLRVLSSTDARNRVAGGYPSEEYIGTAARQGVRHAREPRQAAVRQGHAHDGSGIPWL